MRAVDLSFFDSAPVVVRAVATVPAPRDRVFAAIASDPAGWGEWFPGFSDDGSWEAPPPHGTGSKRVVRAFGARYRETVLAWDEPSRWAFRVDETSMPLFRAFAEDYRLASDGEHTRLTWTVGIDPVAGAGALRLLAPRGFDLVLRRAAAALGRRLA